MVDSVFEFIIEELERKESEGHGMVSFTSIEVDFKQSKHKI